MIRLESSAEADVLWQLSMWHLCGGQIHILGFSVFTSSAAGKNKYKANPVPLKWDSITAEVLLQVCYVCRKTSNFIFLMIIKNTASPTTGLCTSQKALSWLSRIFRSILSLFLSTLGKKRRAELFWQGWSQPGMSHSNGGNLLCLCFCLHKNKFPFPGESAL